MAEMGDDVRWSHLPIDLLTMITNRLNTRIDNLRLRSVCSSWRSSIPPFNKILPHPLQVPFYFPPHLSIHSEDRAHFSLFQSTIYFLQPPMEKNPNSNSNSNSTPWLLRVEEIENGKMHLLNPLSKISTFHVSKTFPKVLNLLNFRITEICQTYNLQFVDLSKKKIQTYWEEFVIQTKKVVLSSNPWTTDGVDYVVMAIQRGKLWFLKAGDKNWSSVDDQKQFYYSDCVHHKGKFFALGGSESTIVIGSDLRAEEIVASMPTYQKKKKKNVGPGRRNYQHKYLVSSCGELFLVVKYTEADDEYDLLLHFKVYKLDEEKNEWEWVENLGDRVFFVGDYCSYSVSTRDFPSLKGDCIYFCDDMFAYYKEEDKNLTQICGDAGVYSFKDGSCRPVAHFPDHAQIFWPPQAWFKAIPRKNE